MICRIVLIKRRAVNPLVLHESFPCVFYSVYPDHNESFLFSLVQGYGVPAI